MAGIRKKKEGKSVFCEEDTLHLAPRTEAESNYTAKDYTTSRDYGKSPAVRPAAIVSRRPASRSVLGVKPKAKRGEGSQRQLR